MGNIERATASAMKMLGHLGIGVSMVGVPTPEPVRALTGEEVPHDDVDARVRLFQRFKGLEYKLFSYI